MLDKFKGTFGLMMKLLMYQSFWVIKIVSRLDSIVHRNHFKEFQNIFLFLKKKLAL